MDPDKMRQCMSLGYSAKSKIANTIGQCEFPPLIGKGHIYLWKKEHSFISLVNEDLFFIYIVYMVSIDGNGFKTSTMRLGADVIMFSRSHGKDGRRLAYFLKSAPTISICSNIDEHVYCLDICVEQIHTHFCCTYIWDNLCAFTRILGCFLSSDYDTLANCKV